MRGLGTDFSWDAFTPECTFSGTVVENSLHSALRKGNLNNNSWLVVGDYCALIIKSRYGFSQEYSHNFRVSGS